MPPKKKERKSKKSKGKKSKKKETIIEDDAGNLTEDDDEQNETQKARVTVKCGKPVLQVTYGTVKFFSLLACTLVVVNLLFAFRLLVKAISMRTHFGYFVNLISKPDGDILPSAQAIPTFLFFILDLAALFLMYKLFSEKFQRKINYLLFILIMTGLAFVVMVFVVFIAVLAHIYSEHASLHDGMLEAMKQYGSDSVVKAQVDRLQIEFQCCGSKKYEEWYEVEWYDASLVKGGNTSEKSSTPFSCCSRASIFPCVHHDIEKTGSAYLYTPEYNLSISSNGCYEIIKQRKKQVGWTIMGGMFLLVVLQMLLFVALRFIQTAHFETGKFEGRKRTYTVWLLGCYSGRGEHSQAPEPPPVPPELMDE